MAGLDTIIATYGDAAEAEKDWSALEAAAEAKQLEIADAAMVENQGGESVIVQRQSHHGWGKGAVAGAVVGILFPPSILGAAVVGAGGGALIARMTRALGRGKVKELGEAFDGGAMTIIAVAPSRCTNSIAHTLTNARTTTTAPSATVEEIQQALR